MFSLCYCFLHTHLVLADMKSRKKVSKKAAKLKLKKRKLINEAGLDKSTKVNEGFSGNNNQGIIDGMI